MPSTPHGQSTLHELELLVKAGLTPQQALIAATADSASIMVILLVMGRFMWVPRLTSFL